MVPSFATAADSPRRNRPPPTKRILLPLEKSPERRPGSSGCRRARPGLRGELALAEGRHGEAIRLLEAANLPRPDPDVLESLAAAHAAAGHLEAAAKRYEELLSEPRFGFESQEDWLRAHVTLGGIYDRLGRSDAARRLYDRLLAHWKDGDQDLVAWKEARRRTAQVGSTKGEG